jgi:hypothetical protein
MGAIMQTQGLKEIISYICSRDFRTRRRKLPPEAFAIGPKREPKPTDPVEQETWSGIVACPDDVSIRTSDHHGNAIKEAYDIWGYWIGLISDIQRIVEQPKEDALALGCLSAADEFQASTYLALTGFYRQAIATLRSAMEGILIGTYFGMFSDPKKFQQWADGFSGGEIWVSAIRRALSKKEPFSNLESAAPPGIFRHADSWVSSLYRRLCAFSHSRPYFEDKWEKIPTTNVGLWGGSNGPVYEPRSFRLWSIFYFDVVLLSLLLVGFSEPRILKLPRPTEISYFQFLERLLSLQSTSYPVVKPMVTYLKSIKLSPEFHPSS